MDQMMQVKILNVLAFEIIQVSYFYNNTNCTKDAQFD